MTTEEVVFTHSPWLAGTRTVGWYGSIHVLHKVVGVSWEEGIDAAMAIAADKARVMHGNVVMNMEIACDPYSKGGGLIELTGTVAKMEPLFAGVEVGHP